MRVPYIVYAECIACGECVTLCPEVFEMDENGGYAIIRNQGGAPPEIIQRAMDHCPTACIHREEV
ncbi:MAG: ferredoxin [Desulfobacca sp.]